MSDYRLMINGVVPIFEAVPVDGHNYVDLADIHGQLGYQANYSTWVTKYTRKLNLYQGRDYEQISGFEIASIRKWAFMTTIQNALKILDYLEKSKTGVAQYLQKYKNVIPKEEELKRHPHIELVKEEPMVVVISSPADEPERYLAPVSQIELKLIQSGPVPIYERSNQDTAVDARELHAFLEVATSFKDWIIRRIDECGLIENQDYAVWLKNERNLQGGRPSKEYALTLDAAKHISMIERNERGKQARQFFIDFEKKHRNPQPLALSGDFGTMLIQAGQQIQQQNLVITTLKQEKQELEVVANQLALDNITANALFSDEHLIGLREAAKIFKLFGDDTKVLTVIRAMTELGWIYKMGKDSPNLPKSTLEAKGYFKTIMPKCNGEEREQAKLTPKGMQWAYPKLCIHFGRPLDPMVQQYIQSLIDKQFGADSPPAA